MNQRVQEGGRRVFQGQNEHLVKSTVQLDGSNGLEILGEGEEDERG